MTKEIDTVIEGLTEAYVDAKNWAEKKQSFCRSYRKDALQRPSGQAEERLLES